MVKINFRDIYSKLIWPFVSNGIYCFNYHRIGDRNTSLFDPNVFSCTAEQFEQHILFYNKEFTVISVEQLIDMIEYNKPIDRKYAVITFDDGYIDNYTIAYPILKKYNTPAALYVVTNYLDNNHIPWWDEIAWIIRHSQIKKLQLENWSHTVDITSGSIVEQIRTVLRIIKQDQSCSMEKKITELENACQCKMPDEMRSTQLFINWQQAKEMSLNGIHIGSHTLSHSILAHLSEEQQEIEVTHSKNIIEKHIGKKITSIAYPVGGEYSFTKKTEKIARNAGYKIGFSYIPGIIKNYKMLNKFNIKRLPIGSNSSVSNLKNIMVHN